MFSKVLIDFIILLPGQMRIIWRKVKHMKLKWRRALANPARHPPNDRHHPRYYQSTCNVNHRLHLHSISMQHTHATRSTP